MIDRDRRLDRLAKLLALESSPNACEAASARRAAESLMRKHGLRREEASGRSSSGYYEHPMGARGWGQAWRFALVTAAARHCGAEALALLAGDRTKVRVVGVRADVERAVELYAELLAVVLELGKSAREGVLDDGRLRNEAEIYGVRECVDAFRRGAVLGVVALLARTGGEVFSAGRAPSDLGGKRSVTPEQGAMVRVEGRRSGQSERVRARYAPVERAADLDDVLARAWFTKGLCEIHRRVVVGDGGVRTREKSAGDEHGLDDGTI